jgi:hypothetical protein
MGLILISFEVLFGSLVGLISWWDMAWCIGGDFNVTIFLMKDRGMLVIALL